MNETEQVKIIEWQLYVKADGYGFKTIKQVIQICESIDYCVVCVNPNEDLKSYKLYPNHKVLQWKYAAPNKQEKHNDM